MAKNIKSIGGELGGSGTTIYKGIISNAEYNASLSTEYGGSGLVVYERMRKSDPIVKASLKIIKLGIFQAEWFIEQASDDPKDVEIKKFTEEAIFHRMDRGWQEVLSDVLTYLDFGFSVVEKVFKYEDDKIWIEKLAFRSQASITRFETLNGDKGITQRLQGDNVKNKEPQIPIEKLLIFTNEKEGDNWRGVSILRSAYKPYFFKEVIEKTDAIGFERTSVGIPVFKMPPNVDPKDSEMADELGQNLRANEKAYLKLPSGWDFEIVYPSGGSARNADEALRRYNREILGNVLAQFLDLGAGNTGSRALSDDQSSAFYRSLQAIADYICSIINEYLIKQLVDLNFDGTTQYPKLLATGIEKINIDTFSSAMQRLVLAGVITPDEELEKFIRKQFRLPEKVESLDAEDALDETSEGAQDSQDLQNKGGKLEVDTQTTDQMKKDTQQKQQNTQKQKQIIKNKEKMKGKKFSYFEGWRPLTFAEENVNFQSLQRQMDNFEQQMRGDLPKIMAPEISNLMNDARQALQLGDAKRVEDLSIKFKQEAMQYILDKLKQTFDAGKLSASNELNVNAPKTSTNMINFITTKASVIADKLTNDLLNDAKLTILEQINNNTPVDQALSNLENILNDSVASAVGLTASVVTSGGINMGRNSVFEDNPDKIYALQRSELLDNRVCNYCISMDGRVIQASDNISKHEQFHFLCRGIWVQISNDETDKPEITGVPQQLRERIGTLQEFQQLPKPMPLKDSLAADYVGSLK